MKRRDLVIVSFLVVLLAIGFSGLLGMPMVYAKEYKIVFAHQAQHQNPVHSAAMEFKKRAEKYSNGRIRVVVHCCGAMGTDKKLMEMVKLGTIDVGTTSNGNYAHIGRAWLPFDLPYIVHGHYNWLRVMTGPIRDEMIQRMEKDGTHYLMAFPGGYARNLLNRKREIRTPADAKGIKMRVVASPVNQKLMSIWGFRPVAIPWGETYTSIVQGIVDGVYIPNIWMYNNKIFEAGKYITESGGIGVWQLAVMNLQRWKSFPKDIQAIVNRAAIEAELAAYEYDQYWSDYAKRQMKAQGIQFYEPNLEEMKQWVKIGKSIWEPLIDQLKLDRNFIKKIQDAQISLDKY